MWFTQTHPNYLTVDVYHITQGSHPDYFLKISFGLSICLCRSISGMWSGQSSGSGFRQCGGLSYRRCDPVQRSRHTWNSCPVDTLWERMTRSTSRWKVHTVKSFIRSHYLSELFGIPAVVNTGSVSLVSDVNSQSEDSLVFEALIPKPMLQRYVSLLQEHRRIILSGPSGTGKSYLAHRLAEHLALARGQTAQWEQHRHLQRQP